MCQKMTYRNTVVGKTGNVFIDVVVVLEFALLAKHHDYHRSELLRNGSEFEDRCCVHRFFGVEVAIAESLVIDYLATIGNQHHATEVVHGGEERIDLWCYFWGPGSFFFAAG